MIGAGETAICADEEVYYQTPINIPATRSNTATQTLITKKTATTNVYIPEGLKKLAANMAMQTVEPKKVAKGRTDEPIVVKVAINVKEKKDARQNMDPAVVAWR